MALLNAEALAYIGRSSEFELACDAVETGAVRRYAQAIMDDDPAYAPPEAGGGGLAPLLYPTHLFRRAWGTPDPIQDHASDPDFDGVADGIGATASQGLPDIPQLQGLRLMNGGSEFEFFRHARIGERVKVRSSYADIVERETSQGPIVFVTVASEFRSQDDDLLLRVRTTLIRR